MKKDYTKLKQAFENDPETLAKLSHEEQMEALKSMNDGGMNNFMGALRVAFKGDEGGTPEKGVDYFTDEEAQQWKDEILKGATPKKFEDYFTPEEISHIVDSIRADLKEEVTPIKGKDYFDGEHGQDADEEAIFQRLVAKIPTPKEFKDNTATIEKLIADAKKTIPSVDDIVSQIKEKKLLELRDIKGARLDSPNRFNMNDQRWHGGGISNITGLIQQGTNVTITGTGTAIDPYIINSSATGGATSVSNVDGSLTISPTTGSVIASLNTSHANVWSAVQTFNNNNLVLQGAGAGSTTLLYANTATTGGSFTFPATGVANTVASLQQSQTFTGANTFSGSFTTSSTSSISNSTGATTANIGVGATLTATTKTINIGTNGVSGSTSNINIGSAVGGALGTTTVNSVNFTVTGITTLNTGLTGILKGTAGIVSVATSGTDYLAPTGTLTTGSALFATAGVIDQDNANYFYDSVNHNLRIGVTSAAITTENKLAIIGNANDYHGTFVQNINAGITASTDMVLTNDLGVADLTTYADLTVNSSGNTNPLMTGFEASDLSLFTSGQLNNINIAVGGTGKRIDFMTGGYLTANKRMSITDAGISIGTTTPTGILTVDVENLGATAPILSQGAVLQNLTAATVGVSQQSPGLIFRSFSWGTTAGTSQDTLWRINSAGQSGTSGSGLLSFASSQNGGAYTNRFFMTSAGTATLTTTLLVGASASSTITVTRTGFAATSSDGMIVNNTSAALVGAQAQWSPRFRFSGTAWNTGGTPASNTDDWIIENQTAGGNPTTSNLVISNQLNAAGYNQRLVMTATASLFQGDVKLAVAGNGLYVKEGSNATMGTATLVGGTLVVSTNKVTATSRIFLQSEGGTITNLGTLYVSARTAGTSFTVTSSNVLDTQTFVWIIVEPA